ncbi:MAG TPA: acyl-CoA reductase [Chloroflexota bacterium]|nr:acyl-CoA reductase [Chloroflexota bacterium]
MLSFDAYWLPGYTPGAATDWWRIDAGGACARAPRLTVAELEALVVRLRCAQGEYLRRLTVAQIAERIGAAINRWLDPFSPYLRQACRLMPAFSGYPEPAVRKGLAGYLAGFRTENLQRLLRDELGDPEMLDGFRPRPAAAGHARATGPALVLHSFAGNVPGLPAQSLVAATLVKAASLGKVAAEEPVFASLFARSLADVDCRLAACLALTYWPGSESALDGSVAAAAFAQADAVVAYGSEPAIAAVRARLGQEQRLIAYGHKLSFGLLTREALRRNSLAELAERAAYDVARFDQQGCLSPHLFYVEEGGDIDTLAFGRALGEALARWSSVIPRGRLMPEERGRIAELRRQQEFRAALVAPLPAASGGPPGEPAPATENAGGPLDGSAVLGGDGDDWCVLVEADPAFSASCLNRTVWVKPLASLGELPALLAPVSRYLQTAGVAATPERLTAVAEVLAAAGIDRICPLGQMGDPLPTWHHDGRFNLLDFLRFTDLEPESGAGRWEFAHPEAGVLGMEGPAVAGEEEELA